MANQSETIIGIFPQAGQPCDNTINGLCDIPMVDESTPLYYPRDCNAPIDPANINGIISEIGSVIVEAGTKYDNKKLDNLLTAITALIQAKTPATPPGTLSYFYRNSVPEGWLKMNGATLAAKDYPALYNAITGLQSTGTENFTLPDTRGEFLRCWIDDRIMTGQTGRNQGVAEADDFKSHTHSGRTNSAGQHTHFIGHGWEDHGGGNTCWRDGDKALVPTTPAGEHDHNLIINNIGGVETRPRNLSFMLCIKI